MEIIIQTLELLFSAFSFLTGYQLIKEKAPFARALRRCALVMGAYWALFLPRLIYLRVMGLTDIGKVTILKEALCLRNSVVPFCGYAGGFALSALLVLLLARVPRVNRWLSAWLLIVMPVTAAEVIAFYTPMQTSVVMVMRSIQLVICAMGAGAALAMWPPQVKRASMPLRAAAAVLAIAGHYILPQITVGALQLLGNRVSFPFDMDALYLAVIFLAWKGQAAAEEQRSEQTAAAPYFDRETTGVIKGVCVVMMFVHHFFTFPHWYVEGISYPALIGFAELFQVPLSACVPVFAFITGYFYAFGKKKSLRYSLEKISGTLGAYWAIQVLLYALAAAGGAKLSVSGFMWELIGLENQVMTFNWYIAFYIMAMLMLPALMRLPQRGALMASLILIGLPVLGATAVRALAAPQSHAVTAAQYMLDGVGGLGAGVIAARYGLFASLDRALGKRKGVRTLAAALLGALAFFGRKFAPRLVIPVFGLPDIWALRISMDVLYAPLLVYAMAQTLPALPGILKKALGEMGRYALHMWLISCVFFNVSKTAYQPLLYLPKNPVLVTLWGLALCYAAARGVEWLLRLPRRRKKIC